MNNERLYYPWGQYWQQVGPTMDEVYAGLVDDQELMAAQYRRYFPAIDRWLSPDPAGLAAADLSNPQSLNRYAYVMNNPLSLVDPLGLVPPCYWVEDERGEHQVCLSGGGPAGSEGSHPCAKVVFADPHVTPGGCGGQVGGGGGGGSGGATRSQRTTAQRLQCAAAFGDSHSVAAPLQSGSRV